ncbi:mandelate racemase/muconate lactonizing enzyme family protein [Rhizobium sp. LC145]|uniref:mandelate racemase/muconate lactonizing enzyme family protein n=1 Tax=Rhizobium sp. LC145 TaxID=1120688 RepID=UPI00062A38DB|nr:mandelate racemase/muconate lactonizing enzyme family protein [Rhizobium sp. LC145]KKX33349.1 isomerase [Rhizobium sp. LC145]TKT43799.1 mandelate racemase/muconate lactonizing enzyme family protein [Rhizobiaceae bacterium LC148]
MKITGIRTFLMRAGAPDVGARQGVPLSKAEQPFAGTRNWLFLKIETDEGITGVGECSGWPRVIETAIKDLAPLLIGEDPLHTEKIWQKMQVAMMGHGMLGTVGGGAMTGIDMALWDIKGKALGVPVWMLLGGKLRDRIPIYSHANSVERARELRQRGIKAIKCSGLADPVEKVAMLREGLGDDMDIAIDLHGPPWLTPADAARLTRALEPYDLLWVEEPLAPENLEGYRRIRDAAQVPLAAGERASTIFGERQLIEEELVDVIQPDTGRAGGLTQMKKIAAMAEAHHIQMAPHSGSLGPVAEYAALHLMASIPNALMLERLDDDWEGRQLTIVPHPVQQDGSLAVPDTPGLGCDIDEEFVARFPSEGNIPIPAPETAGSHRERLYVQMRLSRRSYFNP